MFEELVIGAYLLIAWRHINNPHLSRYRRKAMLVAVVLNDRSEVEVLESALQGATAAAAAFYDGQ